MKLYETISRRRYIALVLLSFALFLLGWQVLSKTMANPALFLPAPLEVGRETILVFQQKQFTTDILASIWRVTVGFVLAVLVAFPLGILAGTVKVVDALVQPLNDFIRYMPVAAFIPLTILWFGIGDSQKMIIIFFGTVFQLIPLIADTAGAVPRHLVELGYTAGAKPRHVLVKIVIPWCLPTIYDHCRVALGWAWSYLIVAELVAASSGIGHVIIQSQRFLQTGTVIVGILTIGVIGLVFDQMFRLPKRYIFPWL